MPHESQKVNCQNCKNNFVIEPDDFSFYEKIKVPPPTFCPECRLQRRLMFRNERSLYKRICDLCKENIISVYSPKSIYKVYCPSCFHSDKWDAIDYSLEYSSNKTFFEQYQELDRKVPHISLLVENNINSPYVNFETDAKNCYLNVGGTGNQDSAYNQYGVKSRDVLDNFYITSSEFCYGNILLENAYKNFHSTFCFECRDAWFSFDCRNCSNIIGCSGLRHQNYMIFNQKVTKEEYDSFMEDYLNGSNKSLEFIKQKSFDFIKSLPQKATLIERSFNSTGNLLKECNVCKECFNVDKSENIKFGLYDLEAKDSYDLTSAWKTDLSYEFLGSFGGISTVKFSKFLLDNSMNVEYSTFVINCQNVFGCAYLKNSKYSILNKEYSKEEYEKLRKKIIEDMNANPYIDSKGRVFKYGEFFPYELSSFSYTETVAYEFFPLSKDEIKLKGYNLFDHEVEKKYNTEIVEPPDNILEVRDDILSKAIRCKTSGKLFNITKMELEFYRRFNLPLPTESPFIRHQKRLSFVSDHVKIFKRICSKCNTEVDSVYKKEEFPIVYCEKCYQQEVY